jgi:signal peptidase II
VRELQERRPGDAAIVAASRRVRLLAIVVATAVVAADQLTKQLALRALAGGPVDVVWTLRLKLTFNTGAAFSLGTGLTPVITALAVVLVAFLLMAVARAPSQLLVVALGLVVGGAMGNLVDRLLRHHGGAVVDFIDLQWWPVFNLADAAVSIGRA